MKDVSTVRPRGHSSNSLVLSQNSFLGCSLLGRIWRRLNHDGGEGGGGAAGERAGEGSGEGGVPHRLLLLVVLETRLDLASGPLLYLRVSVWI